MQILSLKNKSVKPIYISIAVASAFGTASATEFVASQVEDLAGSGYYLAGINNPAVDFDGNVDITLPNLSDQPKGIYGYRHVANPDSSRVINGDLSAELLTDSQAKIWGLLLQGGNDLSVSGSTNLNIKNQDAQLVVARVDGESQLVLNKTIVNASTGQGRLMGLEVYGDLNLGETEMNLNVSKVAPEIQPTEDPRWIQAIFSAGGIIKTRENVTINITSLDDALKPITDPYSAIRAVNLEGSAYNTSATFDKDLVIDINANIGDVLGVYVSGDTFSDVDKHAGVNVEGTLDISIDGFCGSATGVHAQGESGVVANNLNLSINSMNPDAENVGLYSTINPANYPGPGRIVINRMANITLSGAGNLTGVRVVGDYLNRSSSVEMLGSSQISVNSDDGAAKAIQIEDKAKGTFNNISAQVSSKSQTDESVGLDISAGSTVTMTGTNNFKVSGNGATGMKVQNSAYNLTGTAYFEADKALLVDSGSNLSVKNGQLISKGTVQSEGLISLENSDFSVKQNSDDSSYLGKISILGNAESSITVGAGMYNIDQIQGAKKIIHFDDLKSIKRLSIGYNTGDIYFSTNGFNNDQFSSVQDAAKAMLESIDVQDNNSEDHLFFVIDSGAVNDSLSGVLTSDNELTDIRLTKNPRLEALGAISALNIVNMRHELSNLTQRMGELRDSPEIIGSWVRVYGSENQYGRQDVTAKNTSIQIGSDFSLNSWKLGASLSYTDGDQSLFSGSGSSSTYGLALYGTWFSDNGQFLDLMAKYWHLNQDFAINGMNGSYDNNAIGISAEFGWRFNMSNSAFVEPQAQLSYTRIHGNDYTTTLGSLISQDDVESTIGRIGIRAGFSFPEDKGLIYAHFSYLYDFDGEVHANVYSLTSTAFNTIAEDLGGSWIEYGIGANFNWTKDTYTYLDLKRSSSGEVRENWSWNLGLRHAF